MMIRKSVSSSSSSLVSRAKLWVFIVAMTSSLLHLLSSARPSKSSSSSSSLFVACFSSGRVPTKIGRRHRDVDKRSDIVGSGFVVVAGRFVSSASSRSRLDAAPAAGNDGDDSDDDKPYSRVLENPKPRYGILSRIPGALPLPGRRRRRNVDVGMASYHNRRTRDTLRRREASEFSKMMVGVRRGLFGVLPMSSPSPSSSSPSNSRGGNRVGRIRRPGTLILVRHGTSFGASRTEFIGWSDPDVTDRGIREVEHAARLIRESGYDVDVVFTSKLKRAAHSAWTMLRELDATYVPVFNTWRLNERSYGALTGLSKAQVARELGPEIVQQLRGHDPYAVPPPMNPAGHKMWPGKDRRYADVNVRDLPRSESLADCTARVQPLWEDKIRCELENGHNVMVVAHGSTLRGLIKHIQGGEQRMSEAEAHKLKVPPGSPIAYEFDHHMNVVPTKDDASRRGGVLGTYLDKPGLLQKALEREDEWKKRIPGYNATSTSSTWATTRSSRPMSSFERSLAVLMAERELEDWVEGTGSNGNGVGSSSSSSTATTTTTTPSSSIDGGVHVDVDEHRRRRHAKPVVISGHPCLAPLPNGSKLPRAISNSLPSRKRSVIVMIRHGKTEHNKLGIFTGWDDPPLAPEGVEEAKVAGRLLRDNGFAFDVVYTSWLCRAIETAWHVLDGLDSTWLPIVKSWRLNERMYGDLTNKSKKMISRLYGREQFMRWRRGYKIKPPPVNSFSTDYPGNDRRYQKFLTDLPYSVSETIIRSVSNKRFTPSRKLPKTESLHCCMRRTIPYLTESIVPDAVNRGKRVLIASSENAIRGMLMHLCDIPEDMISQLNIPNGVPLVYDVGSRCVKLLDDGTGVDATGRYDFGPAAEYLFRRANNDDDGEEGRETVDEACDISELDDEIWEALREAYSPSADAVPSTSK